MWQRFAGELPEFFGYYNLIFLAKAALTTIALSAIGALTGTVVGFAAAVVRVTSAPLLAPARWLTVLLTEIFRRIPFLVTLMLVFFVFQLSGFDLSMFTVALVAVFLIASSYLAEIIRAGFDSVHRNQWDAAAAMASVARDHPLRQPRLARDPAARIRVFILFIKDTALASQISVIRLTYAGQGCSTTRFSARSCSARCHDLVFDLVSSRPVGARLEARLAASRTR